MPNPTPATIRHIFLTPRPNFVLMTAADLLGMTMKELRRDIADGGIVAVSTRLGLRIPKEEMIEAAMRLWEQTAIEDALGDDAAAGPAAGDPARAPPRPGAAVAAGHSGARAEAWDDRR